MGGVRLNDEGKSQIDGSKLVLDGGRGAGAGKTAQAAHGYPGTGQNDSFRLVPEGHLGHVGLEAIIITETTGLSANAFPQ